VFPQDKNELEKVESICLVWMIINGGILGKREDEKRDDSLRIKMEESCLDYFSWSGAFEKKESGLRLSYVQQGGKRIKCKKQQQRGKKERINVAPRNDKGGELTKKESRSHRSGLGTKKTTKRGAERTGAESVEKNAENPSSIVSQENSGNKVHNSIF